jgi:hypothetical protein
MNLGSFKVKYITNGSPSKLAWKLRFYNTNSKSLRHMSLGVVSLSYKKPTKLTLTTFIIHVHQVIGLISRDPFDMIDMTRICKLEESFRKEP